MNPQVQSLNEVRMLATAELSLKARVGYVGLLLTSAAVAGVVISLWCSEPALPARTQFAFGAMSMIGASWMMLAIWALRARRPLFARDRVIAGSMAVVFTALFTVGAGVAVVMSDSIAAYGALATGMVTLGTALFVLRGARKAFAALAARRIELERELGAR